MVICWGSVRFAGVGGGKLGVEVRLLLLLLRSSDYIQIVSRRTDMEQGTIQCANARTLR